MQLRAELSGALGLHVARKRVEKCLCGRTPFWPLAPSFLLYGDRACAHRYARKRDQAVPTSRHASTVYMDRRRMPSLCAEPGGEFSKPVPRARLPKPWMEL